MTGFYFWSGIGQAWSETENSPIQSLTELIKSPARGDNSWALVKRESRVRLILIDQASPGERLICKIYKVPVLLAWRTFGMVSRANREFTALMQAHRTGLPIVRPISWQDERQFACLKYSAITLQLVDGANLEDLLASTEITPERRRQLAAEKGALLARLHSRGLYWGTAFPRNVLVQESNDPALLVIDTPYSQWHGKSLIGSASALKDLRSALQVKKNGVGFSDVEKYEMLSAYCGDNSELLSTLLVELKPQSRAMKKWLRWKDRVGNVLFHSPRSPGAGGHYSLSDKTKEGLPFRSDGLSLPDKNAGWLARIKYQFKTRTGLFGWLPGGTDLHQCALMAIPALGALMFMVAMLEPGQFQALMLPAEQPYSRL